MLKFVRFEIIEIKIPFRFTFRHALASRNEGHGVVVRVSTSEGIVGCGECVPRDYVTGETIESVLITLKNGWPRRYLGQTFSTFDQVVDSLNDDLTGLPKNQHAAFCAFEGSILDAAGRTFQRSAGEVCGQIVTDSVAYSGVVSADTPETFRAALDQIKAYGLRTVKLKVGASPEVDILLVRTARDTLGQEAQIRVDANCAWTAEEALRGIEALAPFRLDSVEQPVQAEDFRGLAWLAPRSSVPIMVDESLVSIDDAHRLIESGGCHYFNIRVSKNAGLINSARIRDLGARANIGCQVGAQVGETGILSATGRHLAARTPGLLFAEGSYGRMLLERDITKEDLTIPPGGRAPLIEGLGLGVEVDVLKLSHSIVQEFSIGES